MTVLNRLPSARLAAALAVALLLAFTMVGPTTAAPTLATITIDGQFDDWVNILYNPLNVTYDGIGGLGDLDIPQSQARDLRQFIWTYDDDNFYGMFYRVFSSPNVITLLIYTDANADGVVVSTDRVIQFNWDGSKDQYDSQWWYYVPVNPAGDPIGGDGVSMPGTLAGPVPPDKPQPIESKMQGAGAGGIQLEVRIPWTALGMAPGSGFKMQVSSSRGTNLPGQIEDNMGPGGGIDTRFEGVTVTPDRYGAGPAGTSVTYSHTVTNTGSTSASYTISTSGTRAGWTAEVLTPAVGPLAPGETAIAQVRITIPPGATSGTEDVTRVRATHTGDPTIYAEAIDTTKVGAVVVLPDNSIKSAANQWVSFNHTVYNYQGFQDSFLLSAQSVYSWTAEFRYPNGDPIPGNSITIPAGGSLDIVLKVFVPADAQLGLVDSTVLTATSQTDSRVKGTAQDHTEVAVRLDIFPDRTGFTGPRSTIVYRHTVANAWNQQDTINLTAVSLTNPTWTTRIYNAEGTQQISSVTLPPYGGSVEIVVHLDVPISATPGTTDTMRVTATSTGTPGLSDFATDTTTIRRLVVYTDPARTDPAQVLTLGDWAYARAFGLPTNSTVYIQWVDAGGNIRATSPGLTVDGFGVADYQYLTQLTDVPSSGTPESEWVAILYNNSWVELARYPFLVRTPDHLVLSTTPEAVPVGGTKTVTLQVVDLDGRPVRSAQLVAVTALGDVTGAAGPRIISTSLSGAVGVGTNVVTGTTAADGTATFVVTDDTAETVTLTPNSTTLPGSIADPDRDVPTTVTFVGGGAYQIAKPAIGSGDGQVSTTRTGLADFVAKVMDNLENAVASFSSVLFTITSGPGGAAGASMSAEAATTDGDGLANSRLTLGEREGRYTVSADNEGLYGGPLSYTASYASYAPTRSYDTGRGVSLYSSPVIVPVDPGYTYDYPVAYIGTDSTGTDGGWVYALRADNGAKLWEYNLKESPSGTAGNIRCFLQMYWDWGADRFILWLTSDNGHIYAFKLTDENGDGKGDLLWERSLGAALRLSSPIPAFGVSGIAGYPDPIDVLYVGAGNGWMYGLRSSTGDMVMQRQISGSFVEPLPSSPEVSSPSILGDFMYVGSDDGEIKRVRLNDLQVLTSTATGGAVRSSPWVDEAGTRAYVASTSGKVYTLNASNGEVLREVDVGSPVFSSPWVDWLGSTGFYVAASNHRLYRFNVDGSLATGWGQGYYLDTGSYDPGNPAPEEQAKGRIFSSPLILPGSGGSSYAYFGGMDEMFHVVKNNDATWNHVYDTLANPVRSNFYSSPGTYQYGNVLVVGGLDGKVYWFPLK